jgi:hypothetical protein
VGRKLHEVCHATFSGYILLGKCWTGVASCQWLTCKEKVPYVMKLQQQQKHNIKNLGTTVPKRDPCRPCASVGLSLFGSAHFNFSYPGSQRPACTYKERQ